MNPIQQRSEQLVLYALLMRPDLVHEIMSRVSSDMMKDAINKVIFESAISLYVEHKPVDTISVYQSIAKHRSEYKVEAQNEVMIIVSKFSIISGIEFNDAMIFLMCESVRSEHQDLGSKLVEMSKSDIYDPADVLDFLQEHITNNKFKSLLKRKEATNEDLLDELDTYMQKARDKGGVSGIETGYTEFDATTSGMHETNLIIVAARPGKGKTQFSLGAIKHASIDNNFKGAMFSCEMSEVQVMKRLICIDAQIEGYSIKYGKLSRNEHIAYLQSRERIIKAPIKVLSGAWKINDIVAKCHELKNSVGLDYIVVDYIQKVHGSDKSNRNNEVEEVTGKLKDLANELNIPVMALAQLSRAVEQRPDKRPMLSDLRDSGAIEQDADIVVFLYRPGYYMEEYEKATNPMAKDGYLLIAKHRDGDLRDILMRFEDNIPAWRNKNDPPIALVIQEEMSFEEESVSAIKPCIDFDNASNEAPF